MPVMNAQDPRHTMMLQVACKNGRVISLGIWDTAGAERFEALSRMYYNGAKAAVLAFDPCNAKSFEKLKFWVCLCNKSILFNSQSPVLARGVMLLAVSMFCMYSTCHEAPL